MAFKIFNTKEPSSAKAPADAKALAGKSEGKQDVSPVRASLTHVLQRPHISEKAGRLAEKNEYMFVVSDESTKGEIKRAVQDRYKVNVVRVTTSRIPSKKRRVGRHMGIKQGFKKAIVKLAEGHTIEVLPR